MDSSDAEEATRGAIGESEDPGDGQEGEESERDAEDPDTVVEEAETVDKPHHDPRDEENLNGGEKRQEGRDETELSMLMHDPAAVQSKAEQGRNGFSDAPPPSRNEKSRRMQRRRTRPDADDELYRRSGLELEVEELLDNSAQWRKSQQARIRTPVRRAVLSYGGASPGRRQQVLSDLNAKIRELEVAALSRGIACSLQSTAGQQQHQQHHQKPDRQPDSDAEAERAGDGSVGRLDPRVRIAYQSKEPEVGKSQYAAAATTWHNAGRLQSRGHSVRSRTTRLSSEVSNAIAADSTSSKGNRPRRAKTSLTTATSAEVTATNCWSTCVTRSDLLRLQTINGEVQRSLYTERTHGLRRLLHAGGDGVGRGDNGVGGITGIGGSSLHAAPVPSLLIGRSRAMTSGSHCPPATAMGVSRLPIGKHDDR